MKAIKTVGLATLAVLAAAVAFIYSGFYPMGADVPHNALTYWALETLRERSVARAARDIEVPSLDDPALLQRLPELTLEQYQILTAREAGDANQH
jgi:hypothetical protein